MEMVDGLLEVVRRWLWRVLVGPGHSHVWEVTGYKLVLFVQDILSDPLKGGKNPRGIGRIERRSSEAPGGRGRPRVKAREWAVECGAGVSRARQGSHQEVPRPQGPPQATKS